MQNNDKISIVDAARCVARNRCQSLRRLCDEDSHFKLNLPDGSTLNVLAKPVDGKLIGFQCDSNGVPDLPQAADESRWAVVFETETGFKSVELSGESLLKLLLESPMFPAVFALRFVACDRLIEAAKA